MFAIALVSFYVESCCAKPLYFQQVAKNPFREDESQTDPHPPFENTQLKRIDNPQERGF